MDQLKKKSLISLIWGILFALVLLVLFARLAAGILHDEFVSFDLDVGEYIRQFESAPRTNVMIFITHLGSAPVEIPIFLVVASLLYLRLKHRWETIFLGISLAGGWLMNEALKAIFHRSRPSIAHLVEVGGYSFPSGHAMVSTTFYGMIGYLLWLNMRERGKPSWYIPILAFSLIVAIGISRIYLGVHFPSDVIAGFTAGGIWLIACIIGLHAIRYYKSG